MRQQENIVKLIIAKHIDVLEVARLSYGVGIQIDILDQLALLDLALDIIGFPSDGPEFDREKLKENEWDLGKNDIDDFVEQLYRKYDELILIKPHLFVRK